MLYSSGTTGRPKGIRRPITGLAHGSESTVTPLLGGILGLTGGDVYLSPAPLYHAAPLVGRWRCRRWVAPWSSWSGSTPRAVRTDRAYKVTHAQWVPTISCAC